MFSGWNMDNNENVEGFVLGNPSLICRWRLSGTDLALENRHLRALSHRVVNNKDIGPQLVAWAKQHIEWTLDKGAVSHASGVLMLVVDEEGKAAMSVGDYVALQDISYKALMDRVKFSYNEATVTNVAPEVVWAVKNDTLVCGLADDSLASGVVTLVLDLAKTKGVQVEFDSNLLGKVADGISNYDEVFITSDEHGVVIPDGYDFEVANQYKQYYNKLFK